MKLVCPKCNLRMRLSDDKVPTSGAWAQCPRCRERFFINPSALSLAALTSPPVPAPGGGARGRRGGPGEPPPFEPGQVTVYPRPAASEIVRRAASGFLLVLPLLGVGFMFHSAAASSADRPPEPNRPNAVARVNDNFKPEIIRQDLVNLRRELAHRPSRPKDIDYSGSEVRVFKYFMADLLPNVCAGIHFLELKPLDSSAGFSAFGHCVDPAGLIVEMRVEWDRTRAVVSFPLYRRSAELEIYPAPRPRSAALAPALQ